VLPLLLVACSSPTTSLPDIVLVSIDGLRWDRTGLGAHDRPTTPNLDRLADEGVVFDFAFSQSNESAWSHASLLTGKYPSEVARPLYATYLVPPGQVTLPEVLAAAGYRTGGFVAGGHVRSAFGFHQGFETFWEAPGFGSLYETVPRAMAWAEQVTGPRFVFVHGYDCHRPYAKGSVFFHAFDGDYQGPVDDWIDRRNAVERIFDGAYHPDLEIPRIAHVSGAKMSDPRAYRDQARRDAAHGTALTSADIDHIRAHYDGGVLASDTWLGLLVEDLQAAGRWDDTLLVVVSDHGEDLQDHGFSSHRALVMDSTTRVPFVLAGGAVPEQARGRRLGDLVEAIDLVPTLAEVADIAPPNGIRGDSLWPLVAEASVPEADPVFQQGVLGQVSVRSAGVRLVFDGPSLTAPDYRARLAAPVQAGGFELYVHASDPGEQHDVVGVHPELAEQLRDLLLTWYDTLETSEHGRSMSPALREALREAGYWEG